MSVFIFGEAMLEYHGRGGEGLRYGGDTLNTAIHLARAGHDVAYVTALGSDPISDALIEAWQREGIDTRFVLRHSTHTPGIYAIHLDEQGERSFLYWRDRSAARAMFDLPGMDEALAEASEAQLIYFSLISLAIVDDPGRERLLNLAASRREAGRAVAYDSNFRPALWDSIDDARSVSRRAMAACSIGLPTDTDERELWGADTSERAMLDRWAGEGRVVALKSGEKGCWLSEGRERPLEHLPAEPVEVVDTSGAGDAYNAGFLSAHLNGKTARECAQAGQALARKVIGKMGAIPR